MGIGSAEDSILIRATPEEAFKRVESALGSIGKVLESDRASHFVRGTTRYGLQKVRLKCQLTSKGESSRVEIKALADDVWGKGAREGINKLKKALGAL